MNPADLGTTNTWLVVIAIASLVQSAILIALLVGAMRFYRRTESKIEEMQRDVVLPMQARANKVIDELEDVMARARAIDDRVSGVVKGASAGLGFVALATRQKLWPVIGIVRGARAVFSALANRRRQTKALVKLSEDEQHRFNYEGGTAYARTSSVR